MYPSSSFPNPPRRRHPLPAIRGQGHVILGLVPRVSSFTPHRRDNSIVHARKLLPNLDKSINRSVRLNSRLRGDEINTRSRVHPSTNKSMRVLSHDFLRDTAVIRMFEYFSPSLSLSLSLSLIFTIE